MHMSEEKINANFLFNLIYILNANFHFEARLLANYKLHFQVGLARIYELRDGSLDKRKVCGVDGYRAQVLQDPIDSYRYINTSRVARLDLIDTDRL